MMPHLKFNADASARLADTNPTHFCCVGAPQSRRLQRKKPSQARWRSSLVSLSLRQSLPADAARRGWLWPMY
jgi:hypothetical protein